MEGQIPVAIFGGRQSECICHGTEPRGAWGREMYKRIDGGERAKRGEAGKPNLYPLLGASLVEIRQGPPETSLSFNVDNKKAAVL